uniref:Melanoma inhibitory activity protein 2 n=1 Tax=Bos indicus x Bos taurus TaxID=30522 RepID=A0A4W2CCH5_BOBOX
MADLKIHRIFLLVISLTKCLESTKLLADFKKCGDLECEALISRVFAIRDYRGPDCRYLNFTKGEEISVYVKLSGKREDLWAGSKGKDFGYFPRDAVQIEEVFISEEVQIPTKESDFFCLLGISYIFENEASELNSDNSENMYPYEEDNDPKSSVYESDFQIEPGFYSTSESSLFEDQFPASEAPEDIRSTSELEDWEAEAESIKQYLIPEEDHVPPSSAVPEVKGWFGFGKDQAEEKPFESVTDPQEESSFLSRQIAVEDENDPEELNSGEPQTEHKQELELEFDSVPKEQSELLVSELEHSLNPQDTGWFGGGFTSYLGFGGKDTELELSSKESNPPLEDVPSSISSEEESTVPCTEILTEKEDIITNESSILKPSWFDFGFAMLGFAYANEDKMISDDGKNEEGSEEDKHRHPSTSEFDPDKEQEIKLIKVTETENQIGKERVLEKTEDSDTVPYFKKLLYNFDNRWRFQNTPKEMELTFPKQTLDESNVGENDETEEFSAEKYPTDNIEDTLKSGYSQPDMDSEIEFPMRIIEEAHFKTLSSENSDEKLKISLDTERPTQVEMDTSMENTLSNSQILLTDYSLSSQNYIAKKEDASWRQLLEYLFQIDVYDFLNSAFSPIVILIEGAVAALPEDMRQSNLYGFPWELVICATIVGFFAVLLFLWRSFQSLLQEAEEWREQVNELNKQRITFEDSKVHVEQVLCDKENQIKSLTERLRKMKDWTAVLGEEIADDDNLEWEMKSDSENDAHLDNQPKGALKKLIHAAKLRASLKTLEGERNQIYTQLSEVDKTKEELTECIKNLQTEQASLQSENTQFENETQKLQQKLKVMTELYQENEMILHRKLTMEENYRLEKEEKLSKADEKINHAAEELETYRKRAKDLEEELERTIHSYQGQIISHEKKAHDNWLAARTAERNLNDLRKENAHNRQKLTETEFKIELLEKDPYALDVPNTAFGREHSPYGPSPLGRPSPEMRAFLSPPTLLEGPLRLSPLLPGGGGRGSRGPGNPLDHPITNERGESNSDRLTDPHRASSDTGSLSPPWEQDRRMMIPPSGQPYPDPVLLPQRQDRFYSNSGRLSGPAELRSFNMPSLDKTDGPVSSEMESSRNESKDDLGNLNVPDSSLPIENEATGPGFVPPPRPPVRVPLFPMDTRGPFIRRGPPFPPPPPGSMYGGPRDYFPPRDFPGPPPPPFAMRNVYPPRGFPHYLPPRAGFFPPPPHPESRSEFPSGLVPPSNEPTTEHPEPPQEP